jgi:hypothetical protein
MTGKQDNRSNTDSTQMDEEDQEGEYRSSKERVREENWGDVTFADTIEENYHTYTLMIAFAGLSVYLLTVTDRVESSSPLIYAFYFGIYSSLVISVLLGIEGIPTGSPSRYRNELEKAKHQLFFYMLLVVYIPIIGAVLFLKPTYSNSFLKFTSLILGMIVTFFVLSRGPQPVNDILNYYFNWMSELEFRRQMDLSRFILGTSLILINLFILQLSVGIGTLTSEGATIEALLIENESLGAYALPFALPSLMFSILFTSGSLGGALGVSKEPEGSDT